MGKRKEVLATGTAAGSPRFGELDRAFQLIVFDWDGTAVKDRRAEGMALRDQIMALLAKGFVLVIVTGTHLGNIMRQLGIEGHALPERRLYAATNRGSELYGFDAAGKPERLWSRRATLAENERLDAISIEIQRQIAARTGLEIAIVFDRLNRRKIDLIPLPEWQDPPKAEIGKLLDAVQRRFEAAGVPYGLGYAMEVARAAATMGGLPEARITSDVKHVEIGLTDKGDAMAWVCNHLAPALGIPLEDMLVAGDEFGAIAGFPGSDSQLLIPGSAAATFVSVGPEPGGVPPQVLHLGGGPERFRALLAAQAQRMTLGVPSIFIPILAEGWHLYEDNFQPTLEHVFESRFALSNGYAGSRASLAEGGPHSRSSTFLAGVFEPGAMDIPELVVIPDWRSLSLEVLGEPLRLDSGEILSHRRILDMRRGILLRAWRHRSPSGRITRLHEARWLSLADRHCWMQRLWIMPENYSGTLSVKTGLDHDVINLGGHDHLNALATLADPWPQLTFMTKRSGIVIAMGCATVGSEAPATIIAPDRITQQFQLAAKIGESLSVDRCTAVYTSREETDPSGMVLRMLTELRAQACDALTATHVRAWGTRWDESDVQIEGDEVAQRAIRFALYHLIGATNPADERVSIGARALTGEAYKGHVFWDTEIYLLPFYTHTHPPSARALLMYRYHSLDAARQRALEAGYRGALYAWESADTGADVTPNQAIGPNGEIIPILTGRMEHHVSAAVGYAVWKYWQATADDGFMAACGAEMILEIARFWSSRVEADQEGRYHIRRIIGPDEYHEGVDDNAYTNVMAQWSLERGREVVTLLQDRWPLEWARLAKALDFHEPEAAAWKLLAERMSTGFNPETNLYEEFSDYFQLEDLDLSSFENRTVPMDVLLGHEKIAKSQIIKQADVLMLLHTLWERFAPAVRLANYRYYEPRTGHGSSLSPGVHALVAAKLGLSEEAERYFHWAAGIDLDNRMGNTSSGVHVATLGGLWQAVVFGFAGVHADEQGIRLVPSLPKSWQRLAFPLRHRDWNLTFSLTAAEVEISITGLRPLSVQLGGEAARELKPGIHRARRQGEEWQWHTDT